MDDRRYKNENKIIITKDHLSLYLVVAMVTVSEAEEQVVVLSDLYNLAEIKGWLCWHTLKWDPRMRMYVQGGSSEGLTTG